MNTRHINSTSKGKVWLIGAGPGDPGLLTLKGREILDAAETVVYDRLVSEEILQSIPPRVHLINAGKAPKNHPLPQEEINRVLIREAKKGKRVVRLKGGDPFLFGRGWEELLALNEAGIPVEAVPGISSALAVPFAAEIPVTHRGVSSALHVISWHGKGTGEAPSAEALKAFAASGSADTLVILMGGGALKDISRRLIEAGFFSNTPAAVIVDGTTPRQKTVRTTLQDLGAVTISSDLGANAKSPVLTVIGAVCALNVPAPLVPADFVSKDSAPREPVLVSSESTFAVQNKSSAALLCGTRIVVTRPQPKNTETCNEIRALGGEAISFPCIKLRTLPPNTWNASWRETVNASRWLAFTSAQGVESFFNGFLEAGGDFRAFAGHSFAALGPSVAKALAKKGFVPDCVPKIFSGEDLGKALAKNILKDEKVLVIQAVRSEGSFEKILKKENIFFNTLPVYETIPAAGNAIAKRIISEGRFDMVLFASPSAVSSFAEAFCVSTAAAISAAHVPVTALCIGQSTAARARSFGMNAYIAQEASMAALYQLAHEHA
jgi:uroporphyrinogen III methyltransferase/synthase